MWVRKRRHSAKWLAQDSACNFEVAVSTPSPRRTTRKSRINSSLLKLADRVNFLFNLINQICNIIFRIRWFRTRLYSYSEDHSCMWYSSFGKGREEQTSVKVSRDYDFCIFLIIKVLKLFIRFFQGWCFHTRSRIFRRQLGLIGRSNRSFEKERNRIQGHSKRLQFVIVVFFINLSTFLVSRSNWTVERRFNFEENTFILNLYFINLF